MDIKALPTGERVLVDTNIFIYHFGGASTECSDFLRRIARSEVTAYLTTIILAEMLHRQMMAEALTRNLISSGQPLKKLKANPSVITQLTDYITDFETILKLPLQIIEVTAGDIVASHALRQKHGLFVNDSINLACAERLAITDVVTHDADFSRVASINVWEPTDI